MRHERRSRRQPDHADDGRDNAGTGRLFDGDTVLAPGTVRAAELINRQSGSTIQSGVR